MEEDKQLAGFLSAVEKSGRGRIKAIPIVQAKSMSGGPVDSLFYTKIKNLIIDEVTSRRGSTAYTFRCTVQWEYRACLTPRVT